MAGKYKILTKPFYGLIQSGTDARNLVSSNYKTTLKKYFKLGGLHNIKSD